VLNKDQMMVKLNENPWSMDFAKACSNLAWSGKPMDPNSTPYPLWLMKERDTAVYGKGDHSTEVTMTRQASPYLVHLLGLKKCAVYPGIKFVVRARSEVNYYLMFDNCAGACVVSVEKIMLPDDTTRNEREKWKEALSFRGVFHTDEAVKYSKTKKPKEQNMAIIWATIIFASYWKLNLKWTRTITADPTRRIMLEMHAYYTHDIRKLVGVVLWKRNDMEQLLTTISPSTCKRT
jgi:hypothetical protein